MVYLLGFVVGLFLLGVLLVVWGLLGRRMDDHALCGGCGYDLSGMEVDMREVGNRNGQACAECGKLLGRGKKDVRIGNRVRRKGAVSLGLVMMVMVLVVGGPMVGGLGWHEKKPNWMLCFEVRHVWLALDIEGVEQELVGRIMGGKIQGAALRELGMAMLAVGEAGVGGGGWDVVSRDREVWGQMLVQAIAAGVLNQSDLNRAAETMLRLGEDKGVMWQSSWGEVLLEAHLAGAMSEGQKTRWVDVLLDDCSLEMPGKIAPDYAEEVMVWVWQRMDDGVMRGWFEHDQSSRKVYYRWMFGLNQVVVDGEAICLDVRGSTGGSIYRLGSGTMPFRRVKGDLRAYLKEHGEKEVTVGLGYEVEMFSDMSGLKFVREVVIDGGQMKLVKERPGAKLVKDDVVREEMQRLVRPCSQMRFKLNSSRHGSVNLAPYTMVGLEKYQGHYLAESSIQKGWGYEHHVGFVMACTEEQAKKYDGWDEYDGDETFVMLNHVQLERGFCYRVTLRVDGKEYEQEGYISDDGEERRRYHRAYGSRRYILPSGVKAKKCDVILRPMPFYAYEHEHLEEICGDELVFEDVNLLMVTDEELEQGKKGWVELRERAKAHLVEVGEFESVAAIDRYTEELKEQ